MRRAITTIVAMGALAAPAAASATVRAAVTFPEPIRQVTYGPQEEERGTAFPGVSPGSPTVVLVHGGGWREQHQETVNEFEALRLQKRGFAVFDVNYSQDSRGVAAFPLEPDDIEEAIEYAHAHAAEWNGDAANLEMLGGSAGGQLAAIAAEQVDSEAPGTVAAVASLSGPMNLASLAEMAERGELNVFFESSLTHALGLSRMRNLAPTSWAREWSPEYNIEAGTAPAFWLAGSEEDRVPLSQQQEMAAALSAARVPVTLRVTREGHAFEYWGAVEAEVADFLHAH